MIRFFFAIVIVLFLVAEAGWSYMEFTQMEITVEDLELPTKQRCFWTSPEAKICIEQMATFSE